MALDPHSIEFARLIAAWLDETATVEEAAQLWQAVAECPECARVFAGAARFESLLADTLKERAGENAVIAQAAALPFEAQHLTKSTSKQTWRRWSAPLMRAAAVLAALGITAWLLWPHSPAPVTGATPANKGAKAAILADMPQPSHQQLQPLVAPPEVDVHAAVEPPLPDRLDRFFLASVTLDQKPLNEALGILQGLLKELNFLNSEALNRLRVTVPADAAGRRVTFHSGPISFLKAVRAVAALAGCDVTVDEATLALILHREIFPQVPERRDMRNILAGRFNADGSDAASNPQRMADLLTDAASVGIAVNPDLSLDAQRYLPVTRGQWAALQLLTDSREQLSKFAAPNYQLYLSNGEPGKTNQVIGEQETADLHKRLQQSGVIPATVLTPTMKAMADAKPQPSTLPTITVQPLGELTEVTVDFPSAPAQLAMATSPEPPQSRIVALAGSDQALRLVVGSATAAMVLNGIDSVNLVGTVGRWSSLNDSGQVFFSSGTLSGNGTIISKSAILNNGALNVTLVPIPSSSSPP